MPVDEMKIDRSFIQSLDSDPEFATVVRSAIEMGHGLGLKVVAEGIESARRGQPAARVRLRYRAGLFLRQTHAAGRLRCLDERQGSRAHCGRAGGLRSGRCDRYGEPGNILNR